MDHGRGTCEFESERTCFRAGMEGSGGGITMGTCGGKGTPKLPGKTSNREKAGFGIRRRWSDHKV